MSNPCWAIPFVEEDLKLYECLLDHVELTELVQLALEVILYYDHAEWLIYEYIHAYLEDPVINKEAEWFVTDCYAFVMMLKDEFRYLTVMNLAVFLDRHVIREVTLDYPGETIYILFEVSHASR